MLPRRAVFLHHSIDDSLTQISIPLVWSRIAVSIWVYISEQMGFCKSGTAKFEVSRGKIRANNNSWTQRSPFDITPFNLSGGDDEADRLPTPIHFRPPARHCPPFLSRLPDAVQHPTPLGSSAATTTTYSTERPEIRSSPWVMTSSKFFGCKMGVGLQKGRMLVFWPLEERCVVHANIDRILMEKRYWFVEMTFGWVSRKAIDFLGIFPPIFLFWSNLRHWKERKGKMKWIGSWRTQWASRLAIFEENEKKNFWSEMKFEASVPDANWENNE